MTERKQRILLVGGHPADAFDCAGGALAHHADRGDHVTALVLTQGTRVHDVVIAEKLRTYERIPPAQELDALIEERTLVKQREVLEACQIMGYSDVRFLTYSDEVLIVNQAMIEEIGRVIRDVRPDIIITHYPFDNGGIADHHAITGQMTMYAVATAGNVGRDDPNPPHRVPQIFFMALPSGLSRMSVLGAMLPAYPDVFIDISDVIERKIRAMDCVRSQQMTGAHARKREEASDGAFGFFSKVAYAEGFIRHKPELHYYLPLDPFAVGWANEQEEEWHTRVDVLKAHTVPEPK